MLLSSLVGSKPLFNDFNVQASPQSSCNGCCVKNVFTASVPSDVFSALEYDQEQKYAVTKNGKVVPKSEQKASQKLKKKEALDQLDMMYGNRLTEYMEENGITSVSADELKSVIYLYLGFDLQKMKAKHRSVKGMTLNQLRSNKVPKYIDTMAMIFERIVKGVEVEVDGEDLQQKLVEVFDKEKSKRIAEKVLKLASVDESLFSLNDIKELVRVYQTYKGSEGYDKKDPYNLMFIERSELEFKRKVELVRQFVNFSSWIQSGVIVIDCENEEYEESGVEL